jgi:hypothetical protein
MRLVFFGDEEELSVSSPVLASDGNILEESCALSRLVVTYVSVEGVVQWSAVQFCLFTVQSATQHTITPGTLLLLQVQYMA